MEGLFSELILLIFDSILLITDKRRFLRTSKVFNLLLKSRFIEYESNYEIDDFYKITEYGKEKFTLELCHDGYSIPDHYIVKSNTILAHAAAYFNHVDLLDKVISITSDLRFICSMSALGGAQDALIKARERNCPWDENVCEAAAQNDHLSILKWLRSNGCPWRETTCDVAACYGHLEVLQWARANGCPWHEMTCAFAAYCNHLDILKWLRGVSDASEGGSRDKCPWDEMTYSLAAKKGNLEVLQWLAENGCPYNQIESKRYDNIF